MYKILEALAAIIATLPFVGVPPRAQAAPVDGEIILRYDRTALRGGRWSFVTTFQDALNDALAGCGVAPIDPDGTFGRDSRDAVTRLGGCPGFGGLEIGAGERNAGILTQALWRKLLPDEPIYIDGLGAERLSPQEMAAWKQRSRFKASDVGLAEAPIDR